MQDTVIEGIDYGPLRGLIGVWQGNQGVDVAPEPDADEVSPYYEFLIVEAAGDVTTAEERTLTAPRPHPAGRRRRGSQRRANNGKMAYQHTDGNTLTRS